MSDAQRERSLAACDIKKPTVGDEVVADESMTNVDADECTAATTVRENEVRQHECSRIETEHERARKTFADAESFMRRRFHRAAGQIVNRDSIMQMHESHSSRKFRAATGQAESEPKQNEKRRVQELHALAPVVETECTRKMAISRAATPFQTKRAEVMKDAEGGEMSGHAICDKIVVDDTFTALNDVIEFKADEAAKWEWRSQEVLANGTRERKPGACTGCC